MNPGMLLSEPRPIDALILQVAIKNSMDIFYFNVPFNLNVVLVEELSSEDINNCPQSIDDDIFTNES